jgi:hypothetical protein
MDTYKPSTTNLQDAELLLWLVKVGRFRERMDAGSLWKTPSEIDCYRFALAKVGKAIEADVALRMRTTEIDLLGIEQVSHYLTACAVCLATPLKVLPIKYMFGNWPVITPTLDDILEAVYSPYSIAIKMQEDPTLEQDLIWKTLTPLRYIWVYLDGGLPKSSDQYFNAVRNKFFIR